MFSEMIAMLHSNRVPEPDMLKKRFDFALTKKLGVIKLPPAFWMQDPKINPRTDHLFWAALLIKDHHRIDMALSVLAVEMAESCSNTMEESQQRVERKAKELLEELLEQFPDVNIRKKLEREFCGCVPDWLPLTCEKQ